MKQNIAVQSNQTGADWIERLFPNQANMRTVAAAGYRLELSMDKSAVAIGGHGHASAAASDNSRVKSSSSILIAGFGGSLSQGIRLTENLRYDLLC